MKQLARQRIQYLVEYGGLYPAEEPASKNFVVRAVLLISIVVCFVQSAVEYVMLR